MADSLTAPIATLVANGAASPAAGGWVPNPDAIAQTYLNGLWQPRSAWSWEIELRPWVETF